MGEVYRKLKDFDKAIEYFENSLEVIEKGYGKGGIQSINVIKNMIEVYIDLGNSWKAIEYIQK